MKIFTFYKEAQEYGELDTQFINVLNNDFKNKLECVNVLEDCLKKNFQSQILSLVVKIKCGWKFY